MQESKRNKTPFWDTVIGNIIFTLFCIGIIAGMLYLGSLLYEVVKK